MSSERGEEGSERDHTLHEADCDTGARSHPELCLPTEPLCCLCTEHQLVQKKGSIMQLLMMTEGAQVHLPTPFLHSKECRDNLSAASTAASFLSQ